MREEGILLGGEQSGHIILPGESMGDGVLTALVISKIYSETLRRRQHEDQLILDYEAMQEAKKQEQGKESTAQKIPQEVSLSSICSSLQKLPQVIKNQTVSPSLKQAFRNHMPLAEEFINQKTAELNSLGWSLNVRASGTEELVRITIWGDDPDKINQKALAIATDLQALESSL